jgi:hypothetical protein
MEPKRHHYVPKAYLKAFCDSSGKLRFYRKDKPEQTLHTSPDEVALERYYYSQPTQDGFDHSALESFFGVEEGKWPDIVGRLRQRVDVNDDLSSIFTFIGLQRVRVPATRDAVETARAELVRAAAKVLDAAGKLPPKPAGHEDLLERCEVSIDPHQSLHAMPTLLRGMQHVLGRIGIGALHNKTGVQFLTSDNPVVWFDPTLPDAQLQPYKIRPNGPVVLLFPVSPEILLYGDTNMHEPFTRYGFRHSDIDDLAALQLINRQICRFAYQAVIARDTGHEQLIRELSGLSPVLATRHIETANGAVLWHEMIFGDRRRKPKWRRTR